MVKINNKNKMLVIGVEKLLILLSVIEFYFLVLLTHYCNNVVEWLNNVLILF